jgi:hypothetical protein
MSTVSITLDSAVLESFEQLLAAFKTQVQQQQVAPVVDNKPEQLDAFNAIILEHMLPEFGQTISDKIIALLNVCRKRGKFFELLPAYTWLEKNNMKQRQLLKTISAAYRYKFNATKYPGDSYNYSLMSEVKYATICPHCGAVANALVEQLKKEKLWK